MSAPTAERSTTAMSAADALDLLEGRPVSRGHRVVPAGFDPLDTVLLGGFHDRDLVLLGGLPGVGKTIMALQVARNAAMAGTPVTYACYEHDVDDLLTRLILLELALERDHAEDGLMVELVRDDIATMLSRGAGLGQLADQVQQGRAALGAALERLDTYAERLTLVAASGRDTTLEDLTALVEGGDQDQLLVVDYLQKVAVTPEPADEAAKVTHVTEGLKDLALSRGLPILALVAADRAALDTRRLRLHHLRGSSALAYEADVVLLLNEKAQSVSRVHLSYDPVRAKSFRDWVILSVEKNRRGANDVQLEFRKDFSFFRLDPVGRHVNERLVDERLDIE